jgi:hypothetical protein
LLRAAERDLAGIEVVTQAWRSTAQLAGDAELRALIASRLDEEPLVAAGPHRSPAAARR